VEFKIFVPIAIGSGFGLNHPGLTLFINTET